MIPDKTNANNALEEFGKKTIEQVYDVVCAHMHCVMTRGMRGSNPDPLHEAYCRLDGECARTLRQFVMEAIDQTFARFLFFLEDNQMPLPVKTEEGLIVDIQGVSDGLCSEPFSGDGWIARYSSYKHGLFSSSE